jgi:Zn-dependent metalloprotease
MGTQGRAEEAARGFLLEYPDLFGLDDPGSELGLSRVVSDERGFQSVHFRQQVDGVPVLGGNLRADVDPAGNLVAIFSTLQPGPEPPSTHPSIPAARALALGRAAVDQDAQHGREPELLVTRLPTGDRLVWRVELLSPAPARWHLLVDALGGEIVEQRNVLLTVGPNRRTYSADNTNNLPGRLLRREADPPTGDRHADAAHDNAGVVYDYFWRTFGRNSIDGAGGAIESTVHFSQRNNAFWYLSQAVFGDGDGQTFGPLGTALDIVAHELTHGVTESTADLAYYGQSGALNESFSDIFGALVDSTNWEIGETVYTPPIQGDALRSLADPMRYGQPAVWGEYLELPVTDAGDQGGVHANSGIVNHVAYAIAQQIGRDKLARIFYRTLTMKLTSMADFMDARDATVQACGELVGTYGIGAHDCWLVASAYAAAGIGGYPRSPFTTAHRVFLPIASGSSRSCGVNLVSNGGFEEHGSWASWSNVPGAWERQSEGTRSARLNSTDQLVQLVELPANVERLTLSFTATRDSNAGVERLQVGIEDPATHAPVAPVAEVGADLMSGTWQRFTIPLQGVAGRSRVRLVFKHGSGGGSAYVDDVKAVAGCAR